MGALTFSCDVAIGPRRRVPSPPAPSCPSYPMVSFAKKGMEISSRKFSFRNDAVAVAVAVAVADDDGEEAIKLR